MILRKKHDKFKRAREGQKVVPIKAHLTENICLSNADSLISVVRLDGLAYEDKSLDQLETYKRLLNTTYQNIHSPRLGLWNCMLRRETTAEVNTALNCDFSTTFAKKYSDKLDGRVRENRYYLALVYKPPKVGVLGAAFNKRKDRSAFQGSIEDGIEFLENKTREVLQALESYAPYWLGVDANKRSEVGRFYSDLLYFQPHEIPVRTENMANSVFNRRLLFGHEVVEIRHHTESTFAAVLGIKEYAEETTPDMFVQLNSLPFEFNFVQSFLCIEKNKAKRMMEQQRNVLVSSGDVAQSQISSINDALDDLISGRFSLGEHNASLIVHAKTTKALKEHVNQAQVAFQEPGISVVREDIANEAHYLAQLPANTLYRPRVSPITSLNFSSMAPMYGTPRGKKEGNHWGKAILPFLTVTGQPYYHSNHMDDTGSCGIYGMTGAGKTVLMNSIEAMLRRDNIRHVNFDKDEGSKVLIHALGGHYYSLYTGKPTGINLFHALEPTPRNTYYIVDLIMLLVGSLTAQQRDMVEKAVHSVYALKPQNRRLSSLLNFLDPTIDDGVAARLKEWTGDNRNGWVFDCAENTLVLGDVTGFDFTELLNNDQVRTPVVSYLMHRIMELIDGTPICIWMDEFWKLLKHDYFREVFLEDQYKTIRKNEGCMILATQSPADAINSDIARTIIEQTPTTIFLPNERATKEDYTEGFQMTPAEWDIFSGLTKSSRQFLVKQGDSSVLAQLPLEGMNDELNILSGRKANNVIFESLRQEDGTLPKNWIEQYQQAVGKLECIV